MLFLYNRLTNEDENGKEASMRLINIFTPPKKPLLNGIELLDDRTNFKEFFIATAKEKEAGIELNEMFIHRINYIAEHKRLFSEYSREKMKLYHGILVEEYLPSHPDMVFGYYDKEKLIVEGYIKDYNKIDILSLIDYYFTYKSESTYYSKEFFEKEYNHLFSELISNNFLSSDICFEDFDVFLYYFKNNYEEISKLPAEGQTMHLLKMLQASFKNVKDINDQMSLTHALINIGFIDLRRKLKGSENFYTISERAKEVYKKK